MKGFPTRNQIAEAFGIVTPEDKARWEQMDRATAPDRSAGREAVAGALESVGEVGRHSMQSRLRAAHQVDAEQQQRGRETRVRTITETVDFVDRDTRRTIHDEVKAHEFDFDF